MTVQTLQQAIAPIEGWLTEREAALLYRLAQRCTGRGVIVEIGSWQGKSTICLGLGSRSGHHTPIYAIDPHPAPYNCFEQFQHNIAQSGLDSLVTPIVQTSQEAATQFDLPVELLFIDGSHEYEAVQLDYELWFPRLVEGGIVALHDTIIWSGWPGPRAFAAHYLYPSPHLHHVTCVDSITYGQKVARASWTHRGKNYTHLWRKQGYEWLIAQRLPWAIRKMGNTLRERWRV
jgi:MMP 1-O-methyltransferase